MTRAAARHSCDSPDWITPPAYAKAAHAALGGITLDPASDPEANRIIRARRIYTARENGLTRDWSGRVFLNPPGGLVLEFWRRLMRAWDDQEIEAAIWIGYSLEQLQTLQAKGVASPLDFPICVPDRRIAFWENAARLRARLAKIHAENKARRREGRPLRARTLTAASPTHANYVTYVGRDPSRFVEAFSPFGAVRIYKLEMVPA